MSDRLSYWLSSSGSLLVLLVAALRTGGRFFLAVVRVAAALLLVLRLALALDFFELATVCLLCGFFRCHIRTRRLVDAFNRRAVLAHRALGDLTLARLELVCAAVVFVLDTFHLVGLITGAARLSLILTLIALILTLIAVTCILALIALVVSAWAHGHTLSMCVQQNC